MSDGPSDANRQAALVYKVEVAAEKLSDVLLETGCPIFKVSPMAVELANEWLKESGYKLVKAE